MTQGIVTTERGTLDVAPEAGGAVTRALLVAGAAAGPLYLGVGLIEAFTRPGFDIRRHDLSLLANGPLGWIHMALLVVSGLLVVLGAVGLRRAVSSGRARTWGPPLIAVYGLGMIAAGFLTADPALGFPPGTPAGASSVSWHGALHLISAAIGFLSLIAGCVVYARRFAGLGETGWAIYSLVAGIGFLAGFAGIASGGPGNSWTILGFWLGLTLAWSWITATTLRLAREA